VPWYYALTDLQELSVVMMQENSNIYDDVADEMKKVRGEHDTLTNEVDTIKADGGTVSKDLKKRKSEKVVVVGNHNMPI